MLFFIPKIFHDTSPLQTRLSFTSFLNQHRIVDIEIRSLAGRYGVRNPAGKRDLSLLPNVQTSSGGHSASSYSIGNAFLFWGNPLGYGCKQGKEPSASCKISRISWLAEWLLGRLDWAVVHAVSCICAESEVWRYVGRCIIGCGEESTNSRTLYTQIYLLDSVS